MQGERINEYDVIVTAGPGEKHKIERFAGALRKAGVRTWKLSNMRYQVSFGGQPALRELLPPVGTVYKMGG